MSRDIFGATREIAISSEFEGDYEGPNMLHLQGEAGPWCVTLAPLVRANGGTMMTHVRDFRAVVAWGAGGGAGARAEAVIDWPARGGTFAINGSDLDLRPVLTRVTGGPPDFGAVRFSAFAARALGPRAGAAPTRSIDLGFLAGAASSAIYPVPAFAKRFRLYSSETLDAGVAATITWGHGGGTLHRDLWVGTPGAGALTPGVTYGVPERANTFVFANAGGLGAQFFVAFDLDVG